MVGKTEEVKPPKAEEGGGGAAAGQGTVRREETGQTPLQGPDRYGEPGPGRARGRTRPGPAPSGQGLWLQTCPGPGQEAELGKGATVKQEDKQEGDRPLRDHAYLRRGLGQGSPGGGRTGQLGLMVDSDLRGGRRGAVWRRRRALVLFCRGTVTAEGKQRVSSGGRS